MKDRKKFKSKNYEKGITLITLVITVIVILILAVVSIAILSGENGIITKANIALTLNESAQIKEKFELWKTEKLLGNVKTPEEFLDELIEDDLISDDEKDDILEDGYIQVGDEKIPLDEDSPLKKELEVSDIGVEQFTLIIEGEDVSNDTSISAGIDRYEFYINGKLESTVYDENGVGVYTATEKIAGTIYICYVITYDKLGNSVISDEIEVETVLPVIKIGDYVTGYGYTTYWRVLSISDDGIIEIVTEDSITTVTLGDVDIYAGMTSYEYAVQTLNNKASSYKNTTYAQSARSLGSYPENSTIKNVVSLNLLSGWGGYGKPQTDSTDTYYTYDQASLNAAGINFSTTVWYASRYMYFSSSYITFGVRYRTASGTMANSTFIGLYSTGPNYADDDPHTRGYVPVIKLKEDVITTYTGAKTEEYNIFELSI